MDICQHRNAGFFADFFQDAQTLFQPRPAKAMQRRAVGLVIRRFENVRNLQLARHRADLFCHLQRMRFTFNHAWAGDEKESGAEIEAVEPK